MQGKNNTPYIVTHDRRIIRQPHTDIYKNDSIKLNLQTGEIDSVIKFKKGASVFVTSGKNIGRVGTIVHVEPHPGNY